MWVVNAEGVYIENRPYHSYLEDDIITAINEKYGTNFSSLTYLREPSIAIGVDCPNWSAYEKIVITSQKIAIKAASYDQNYTFIIGTLSGENFEIITNGSNSCGVDANGVVVSYNLPGADNTNYVKGLLQGHGIIASTVTEKVVSWQIGDSVQNWSEYTQYT